jgi:hypothetical protein
MRFQVVSDPRARSAARRGLTALAAAACGLVMTGCGSQGSASAASSATSPTSTGSSSAAGADACTTAQLKISLIDTGALAGQAGGYLKFTDESRASCRMSGWPAVAGLTAAGKATALLNLQSTMFGAWHYTSPPPVLTLSPGDAAYAVVAADDHPAGSSTSCPAPYMRLRVSPPGDSASATISAWLPGARSYLPSCPSAKGTPTAGTSTITTLASLPH